MSGQNVIFVCLTPALGSTPTSGRAVQQKVAGRFNHGVNFFDAFCHQDGVSLFVWTQQLHHTMTSCAQSTFTFLSATSCNALLLESVPAMAFVEHKSLGTAGSNSMPGTAGTVQPLDWAFTWNVFDAEQVNTSREPEPGPSCMQAGPALRNFAGKHFPLLTSRPCVFNLLAVLRFGFRHDGRHAHILTLQGFDHHFCGSVPSKVLWLH